MKSDADSSGAGRAEEHAVVELEMLWKPILLSAVLVFVASSVIWMVLPIHKKDYKDPGASEGPLLDLLRTQKMRPGMYYIPWCHGSKTLDEATKERLKNGPWAMLTVHGAAPNMGKMLGLWMLHLVIVSVFIAYLASHAGLGRGAEYLGVFRVVGAAGLLAHAGYALPMAIWHGMPWSQLPGRLFDGVVYALLTAGVFAWLWPAAVAAA